MLSFHAEEGPRILVSSSLYFTLWLDGCPDFQVEL